MSKIKLYLINGFLLSVLLIFFSCEKFFDVNTGDIALEENVYEKTSEVYAGFFGVASAVRNAADHYIIMAELLGDLIEPTENAPDEMWDIFYYRATNGNSYASPQPFYNIVVNANDFLRHIVAFNKENPDALSEPVYNGFISAAINYRVWAYLAIGKIYGEALYYDLALVDDNGLEQARMLDLDQLLIELINNMKIGIDGVNAFQPFEWKYVLAPMDNTQGLESWEYTIINPDILLAELYLWRNEQVNAAESVLSAIAGTEGTNKYKLSNYYGSTTSWINIYVGNFSSIENEAFTAFPFEYKINQQNKLQYYFSNIYPNVYYLKPTNNLRALLGNTYTDRRYSYTFQTENGNSVFARYHYGENREPYVHDNHIYIYRAAEAWLMAAEALSNLGSQQAADSIINDGLRNSYNGTSFNSPFDFPIYNINMRENRGVRGRVNADPIHISDLVIDSLYINEEELHQRKKFVLDSLIANEVGCELAGEGKRWFTLVRMARNNNQPEIVADRASLKFNGASRELYKIWLMDPKNWFIKYNHLGE